MYKNVEEYLRDWPDGVSGGSLINPDVGGDTTGSGGGGGGGRGGDTETSPPVSDFSIQSKLGVLRRGALIQIGSEVCVVENVTHAADGTVCFETHTTSNHTTSDTVTGVDAIQTLGATIAPGDTLISQCAVFTVSTGTGDVTTTFASTPFVNADGTFYQDSDYIHLSLYISGLSNLTEGKIIFNAAGGQYFKSFQSSELFNLTANPQGITQLLIQQSLITAEAQTLGLPMPDQSITADAQWVELIFPISEVVFQGAGGSVGQAQTLQNVTSAAIEFIVSGTITVNLTSFTVFGGYPPDSSNAPLNPYFYKFRGRDSRTGAKSNPSPEMRYGLNIARAKIRVLLPSSSSDNQIDTWDVFRMGGSVSKYRYIGSSPVAQGYFDDIYSDAAAIAGNEIDTDCYEPFPSIDFTISPTITTLCGTVAVATGFGSGVTKYLPGTLVRIGTLTGTLWTRPTLISGSSYLLQFVEDLGIGSGITASIPEPIIANVNLPFVWGPDVQGRLYGVGDSLRFGGVYWTNSNNPDGASDKNFKELCPPNEPLMNGCVISGVSVVFSTMRAWAGYPQSDGSINWTEIPVGAGLVAGFGICTDGKLIYYLTSNGVRAAALGSSVSLTDADLKTLFGSEGVDDRGTDFTYAGVTIKAIDYTLAPRIRLNVCNDYLYLDYPDSPDGIHFNYHTLTLDLRTKAWKWDVFSTQISIHATNVNAFAIPKRLYLGDVNGNVNTVVQTPVPSSGETVAVIIATREEQSGDIRAPKQWGDLSLDMLAAGGNVIATPMLNGTAFGSPTIITGGQSAHAVTPVPLNGEQRSQSLGLKLSWNDQGVQSKVFSWQPTYTVEAEEIIDRASDPTNFGLKGFTATGPYMIVSHQSTQDITFTFTRSIGTTVLTTAVTIPNSGGVQTRTLVELPPMKGLLWQMRAQSSAKFQIWNEESVIIVRAWDGDYQEVALGI